MLNAPPRFRALFMWGGKKQLPAVVKKDKRAVQVKQTNKQQAETVIFTL